MEPLRSAKRTVTCYAGLEDARGFWRSRFLSAMCFGWSGSERGELGCRACPERCGALEAEDPSGEVGRGADRCGQ